MKFTYFFHASIRQIFALQISATLFNDKATTKPLFIIMCQCLKYDVEELTYILFKAFQATLSNADNEKETLGLAILARVKIYFN